MTINDDIHIIYYITELQTTLQALQAVIETYNNVNKLILYTTRLIFTHTIIIVHLATLMPT